MSTVRREPLGPVAVVVAALAAILTALIAFGVDVSEAQVAAILGVASTVGPIIVWLWGRRRVTPVADPRDDDGAPLTRADGTPAVSR